MGRTAGTHLETPNPSDDMGAVTFTETGTIREKPLAKPRDRFFVSDTKKKEYGIKDHEECYWARDPKVWASIEHSDRVTELEGSVEDGGMDGRLVRNSEMDTIHIGGGGGDLVLMAIPKDVRRWQQEEIDAANVEYEAPMRQTEEGYEFKRETLERDAEVLERRMRAEHEYHRSSGLAGGNSPTAGMSYSEAEAHMKRIAFDVAGQQEMLRNGGHHQAQSDEQFTRMLTGNAKSFGFGKTGIGKTTAQKVAERSGRR